MKKSFLAVRRIISIFIYFLVQEENKSSLDDEYIEMVSKPSTSQGNGQTDDILLSMDNQGQDTCEHEESFATKQLFSFAWQIAKGMVINFVIWIAKIHRYKCAKLCEMIPK